jgi:ABC-2 type transport system permease protein
MNPTVHAVRLGLARGRLEFRQVVFSAQDISFMVVTAVGCPTLLYFQRRSVVTGNLTMGMLTMPSLIGLMVAVGGIVGVATRLSVDREDGTLLRARAIPNGTVGYVVARVSCTSLELVPVLLIIVASGLILLPGLATSTGIAGWLSLLGFVVLGLAATLPWGAIIGSLLSSPDAVTGLTILPIATIAAISGIFQPISNLPGWVQGVAQFFPVYWLGLGMRSALLDDQMAVAEIGHSWRVGPAIAILSAWAVAGFLLAPLVLRRMARRESGSAMEERRRRAMQRASA